MGWYYHGQQLKISWKPDNQHNARWRSSVVAIDRKTRRYFFQGNIYQEKGTDPVFLENLLFDCDLKNSRAAKAEFDRTDSTEESVKAAVDKLDAAIKALVTRANGEEVKAYINGIELKDASKYTEESYKVYKDAYQKLCGVLDRLDNVSQEEYLKLRNAFETAEANLVEKDAAKPEQPNQINHSRIRNQIRMTSMKFTQVTQQKVVCQWHGCLQVLSQWAEY